MLIVVGKPRGEMCLSSSDGKLLPRPRTLVFSFSWWAAVFPAEHRPAGNQNPAFPP